MDCCGAINLQKIEVEIVQRKPLQATRCAEYAALLTQLLEKHGSNHGDGQIRWKSRKSPSVNLQSYLLKNTKIRDPIYHYNIGEPILL